MLMRVTLGTHRIQFSKTTSVFNIFYNVFSLYLYSLSCKNSTKSTACHVINFRLLSEVCSRLQLFFKGEDISISEMSFMNIVQGACHCVTSTLFHSLLNNAQLLVRGQKCTTKRSILLLHHHRQILPASKAGRIKVSMLFTPTSDTTSLMLQLKSTHISADNVLS